ncbi:short chain dehydrogenase/reductase family [Lindgomyces ingoldianus]|uniref:Short chain dehydrogenase/reductase family n=1 Tax=Lindgomyces ingoldianus TaxID=673940 RepID=A0ACB6QCT0_9PLEO|nr:short chain dehydrogenase/reductase family [Lindgomyces ingoldianus]KAF2464763.1 short chain dehydrogenase/reductase family [Lindgomyces ingoldianus]
MADLGISDIFNVNGMVFVVTGGGSGLGEWMALALDKNGASKVFILGRRAESLNKVAQKAANRTLVPITCDISSKQSLKSAVEQIEKQTPFVNAVIANSGIAGPITSLPPRSPDATISSIQEELWNLPFETNRQVMDINLMGSYYTFIAFMHLLEAGNTHAESRGKKDFIQSQFITVASMAAFSRNENVSHLYAASKAALVHLTKTLSTGFATKGIRVNSIAPGLYITEMTEASQIVSDGKDFSVPGSMPVDVHPMTRTGGAKDIAGAILFLTSQAGAYVNGNVLLTDGGMFGLQPMTY